MMKWFCRFLDSENGSTAIEYALIAGLIFLAIVSSVTLLGQNLLNNYWNLVATIP